MYSLDEVKKVDPEVAQAIIDEENRQNSHIELIASENWVSKAVMARNNMTYSFGNTPITGSAISTFVDNNLSWEKKKSYNVGPRLVQQPSGIHCRMVQEHQ